MKAPATVLKWAKAHPDYVEGVGPSQIWAEPDEDSGGQRIFVYLARGYCASRGEDGLHHVCEYSAKDTITALKNIAPCGCGECK